MRGALHGSGVWRVYFNRSGAFPLVWCIAPEVGDAGGCEIAVASVEIAARAETVYELKGTPNHEDGRPSAWFRVAGRLSISPSGHARIE